MPHEETRQSVCLITALTVADFIDPDLILDAHSNTGAQLGVLTLASLLRQRELSPVVINLDDLFFEYIVSDSCRDGSALVSFFSYVAGRIGSESAGVFGLSSICSSYPLTLRLAQEIRRRNPCATIVMGGPQASVVDVATMQAFSCVDVIVRGEADHTFPELLRLLARSDPRWQCLPGITFVRDGTVVRNQNAPVVENLDQLPTPAFDLDSRIRERGGIHLEAGRGCPFACTFCSTNDFFRRNFRLKSPHGLIDEIRELQRGYGLNYFSLVHDMYTVDRKKVVEFCDAILKSGENFTWGCSARTDCIDDELLGYMAKAGCTGIFFGIESGSQRLQHVINKNLDLADAIKRIKCASSNGIRTTVALIVGFPEESRDDLRDTIHFFIDSLRFQNVEPQCSLLAPLAATPIYEKHKDELVFDHIFSDISNQSWWQDPVEREMIQANPDVFPNFYAIPTVQLDRRYVKELTDFVTYLATWFRWLPVTLLQDSGDMLRVFDRWQRWRLERSPDDADENTGWTPYYSHRRFHKEFLEFVETCYLAEMAAAPAAVSAVHRAESTHGRNDVVPVGEATDSFGKSVVPYRLPGLVAMDFEVDYFEVVDALRNKRDLRGINAARTTVIFAIKQEQCDVWQLSPLSAALLKLCDGERTVADIAGDLPSLGFDFNDIPVEKVCLFGLMQLKDDGVIGASASPVIWQPRKSNPESTRVLIRKYPPNNGNTQQPWPSLYTNEGSHKTTRGLQTS